MSFTFYKDQRYSQVVLSLSLVFKHAHQLSTCSHHFIDKF